MAVSFVEHAEQNFLNSFGCRSGVMILAVLCFNNAEIANIVSLAETPTPFKTWRDNMLLLLLFFQAYILGLSGAMMPGPLLTYDIQLALKKGFWVGPKLVLGHAILEAFLIIGLLAGLTYYIQLPFTKITFWLLGGFLLLWMGWELVVKESRSSTISNLLWARAKVHGTVNLHPLIAGIVISLTNPYWALWWATIGLSFITRSFAVGFLGVFVFFMGHILADLSWYTLVSGAIARGKQYITEPVYRYVLIGCGLFLIFLALTFMVDAVRLALLLQR